MDVVDRCLAEEVDAVAAVQESSLKKLMPFFLIDVSISWLSPPDVDVDVVAVVVLDEMRRRKMRISELADGHLIVVGHGKDAKVDSHEPFFSKMLLLNMLMLRQRGQMILLCSSTNWSMLLTPPLVGKLFPHPMVTCRCCRHTCHSRFVH